LVKNSPPNKTPSGVKGEQNSSMGGGASHSIALRNQEEGGPPLSPFHCGFYKHFDFGKSELLTYWHDLLQSTIIQTLIYSAFRIYKNYFTNFTTTSTIFVVSYFTQNYLIAHVLKNVF